MFISDTVRRVVPSALLLLILLTRLCVGQDSRGLHDLLTSENVVELAKDVQRFGDPVRGALAFFKLELNCARCHNSESGRHLGPKLGEQRKVTDVHLIESILGPSEEIKEGYESVLIQLINGQSISGVLVEESDTEIVIDQIQQPKESLRLNNDEIDDWRKTTKSSMPDKLANQLADRQQFLDLVCYLSEIARLGPDKEQELRPSDSVFSMLPLPAYEAHIDHRRLIGGLDKESLSRGSETYRLRCESCHGTKDAEGSLPTSLRFHLGSFKNGNDPLSMYKTLTHGYGMMNAQRWMVPREKYDVIHFVRETILREDNQRQYFEIDASYLANLPVGDTIGPEPIARQPWTEMDYGPSLNNTIEISNDGSNIAQKGIAIRLDHGPGGVESGRNWILYDHDTMRVAGAWNGGFIDFNGIHLNGVHGRHPRIAGQLAFENPVGPGWARPTDNSFLDERIAGRDGKRYGPLPRNWLHYKGFFRFGNQTILKYLIGNSVIYELPGLTTVDAQPVVTRQFTIGSRDQDLTLQVLRTEKQVSFESKDARSLGFSRPTNEDSEPAPEKSDSANRLFVNTSLQSDEFKWITTNAGDVRLKLHAGPEPVNFVVNVSTPIGDVIFESWHESLRASGERLIDLSHLSAGGPANWPQKLKTNIKAGSGRGPFQVDVLQRPVDNPWNDRMRLTGVDFFANGNDAAVCCWDGSVYRVYGIDKNDSKQDKKITWRRIAAGLFQPLGIRIVDDQIFVCCRDQIVRLQDLNNDDEIDYYENFNNDHQVTEHFHEFAMGLQTDDEGNFYYAKSARHALEAVVPHHGTLLKVDKSGETTTILANGFRAANGVCLNPDGTFFVTDQEGHWNPKNRINWVEEGGFYGNMLGYHDVSDSSDDAMDPPLCWITNSFDRSPAELLWVTSKQWKPLQGALLNFSYGNGKVFVVPHEKVNGQFQGGVCELPLPVFPTGIMRGRFHPVDGQLYCCGMFAWSGNQQQPGGFYRVRYTGEPVHLPVEINAKDQQLTIRFSGKIDLVSASNIENFRVSTWDIKRSSDYGSDHYNTKELEVTNVVSSEDRSSIVLTVPNLMPTWCMEIKYSVFTEQGERLQGTIHNTIHQLAN